MIDNAKEIAALILRHSLTGLNEQEKVQLDQWIEQSQENRVRFKELTSNKALALKLYQFHEADLARVTAWNTISESWQKARARAVIRRIWLRAATAAAVLIVVLLGAYLWLKPLKKEAAKTGTVAERYKNDIQAPIGAKATLTLSDGSIVG